MEGDREQLEEEKEDISNQFEALKLMVEPYRFGDTAEDAGFEAFSNIHDFIDDAVSEAFYDSYVKVDGLDEASGQMHILMTLLTMLFLKLLMIVMLKMTVLTRPLPRDQLESFEMERRALLAQNEVTKHCLYWSCVVR